MSAWSELILILVILTNLLLVGGNRLTGLIRFAAVQGLLAGLLPLLVHSHAITARLVFLAALAVALKGVAFPLLLGRALREADIRREVEPFVGSELSTFLGISLLAFSFWLSEWLGIAQAGWLRLMLPVGFFTMMTGLFLIISRHKALTQVLGYLVMENGIFLLGVALVGEVPFIVELGVLLDAFVAVFVMGIAIHHINREFNHMDVHLMARLKE